MTDRRGDATGGDAYIDHIIYDARHQQIIDFDGLRIGTALMTDMDGLMEYHNRAYVLLEIKYLRTPVKDGQRLALERMVDDTTKAGKRSIAIIGEHAVHDPRERVRATDCKIREYYWQGRWMEPVQEMRVGDAIKRFINRVGVQV